MGASNLRGCYDSAAVSISGSAITWERSHPWRDAHDRSPPVRPIAHLSLVDRVTDELHRAILNGDIKPGSAVSIVELCEQFDVSHIPVREALRRLESEGLRQPAPRPLGPGRLAERSRTSPTSTGCAQLIEGDLTVRAIEPMTDERLDATPSARSTSTSSIEREPAALAAAHHAFHAALLADVMGAVDRRVLELLWHAADRYLHLLMDDLDRAPETRRRASTSTGSCSTWPAPGKAEAAPRRLGRPPASSERRGAARRPAASSRGRTPADPSPQRDRTPASAHGRPSTRSVPLA